MGYQAAREPGISSRYFHWLDGSYLTQDASLPLVPHNTNGQLDAGNNLRVHWRTEVPVPDGAVIDVYHQCLGPTMVPASAPELLTGQEATAARLLPAADETGHWTLVWEMPTTGEAKIWVWLGCAR